MTALTNPLLLAVILINFFTLGSTRLGACIRIVAIQGALLAMLPLAIHGFTLHAILLATGAFCFKGLLIPWLLFRAIREVRIRRELEPIIGFVPTLALGVLTTAGAFLFADVLPLAAEHHEGLLVPTALATMFAGFLLLISRRKAITQVLGYLMLENGIFVIGVLLSDALPLMVEAGVLLDLLVAVFVMGIVMNHISREFATINTEGLSALKE
ncbi:MAG: hydrogenase [Desulfuromonadales bacterium]|nr:hydrogenase [Desulfuromonadales bacterium]